MSHAASSSSNLTPAKRRLFVDLEELTSPIWSPVRLAAQQPRRMEMDAATAAVSSKSKPVVIDLEELPSPTSRPANRASTRPMETSLAASSSKSKFTTLRTEAIFADLSSRRDALIRALTTDQEEFFDLCDPGKKALLLYGHTDGNWEVTLQEEVAPPSDMPEPALGLNFVRDAMTRFDWLSHVAAHADAWLDGLTDYFGQTLSNDQRMRLSDMIIGLPTVYETIAEFYEHDPNNDSRINDEDIDEELEVSDQTFCSACGARYHANEFWICCDICDRWFHGECAKITASEAD